MPVLSPDTSVAQPDGLVPLKLFYHATRRDNFTTATPEGEREALGSGYGFSRVEALVYSSPRPGTVPLKLFFSKERGDNFTTATAIGESHAKAANYVFVRNEGYIYPTQRPGTVPLKLFWSDERRDNFTTATAIGESHAVGAKYHPGRIEGYVYPAPAASPATPPLPPLPPNERANAQPPAGGLPAPPSYPPPVPTMFSGTSPAKSATPAASPSPAAPAPAATIAGLPAPPAYPPPVPSMFPASPTKSVAAPPAASAPVIATAPAAPPPAPQAGALSGRRVALVIGNSAYESVARLNNPQRDAAAVAAALRGVGFQSVTVANDLTRERLVAALIAFSRETDNADWGVVYFAGHGLEVGGVNYLIPIDARLRSDRDIELEGVSLTQVLGAVERARKLRLVLLDACRDNPFASQMRRTLGTRSVGRGLASVEPEAGTLVVYAAKHGETALDGDGANSPFATALVKNLRTPGIEVRRLFDFVRDEVLEVTNRRQQPYSYGSLPGREDYYFTSR